MADLLAVPGRALQSAQARCRPATQAADNTIRVDIWLTGQGQRRFEQALRSKGMCEGHRSFVPGIARLGGRAPKCPQADALTIHLEQVGESADRFRMRRLAASPRSASDLCRRLGQKGVTSLPQVPAYVVADPPRTPITILPQAHTSANGSRTASRRGSRTWFMARSSTGTTTTGSGLLNMDSTGWRRSFRTELFG
jgi:hypothetical protein